VGELPKRAVSRGRRPGFPKPATVPGQEGQDAEDRLSALRWHIDRYDRLRASTASRAGVVLSASAILSAGNAVVLAQVLGGEPERFSRWVVLVFAVGVLAGVALVVRALLQAARVLVTPRPSGEMFSDDGQLPPALLFNGTYTAKAGSTYEEFRSAVAAQSEADRIEAAQVELYVCIRQHRHRYVRLRGAVRSLAWAAGVFLLVVAVGAAGTVTRLFL
jgi:hypothetical protein